MNVAGEMICIYVSHIETSFEQPFMSCSYYTLHYFVVSGGVMRFMMENVKLPRFSARLKQLCKEKGCKQIEMAELLGLTETHYQRVEYG